MKNVRDKERITRDGISNLLIRLNEVCSMLTIMGIGICLKYKQYNVDLPALKQCNAVDFVSHSSPSVACIWL